MPRTCAPIENIMTLRRPTKEPEVLKHNIERFSFHRSSNHWLGYVSSSFCLLSKSLLCLREADLVEVTATFG